MITRNADDPLTSPLTLVLDAQSFYMESSVEPGVMLIPFWAQAALDSLAVEYSAVALFAEDPAPGKVKTLLKRIVGRGPKPREGWPTLGRELVLPREQWSEYLRSPEVASPLVYCQELSHPDLLALIPARHRMAVMADPRAMRVALSNYQLRRAAPADKSLYAPIPDIQRAHQRRAVTGNKHVHPIVRKFL